MTQQIYRFSVELNHIRSRRPGVADAGPEESRFPGHRKSDAKKHTPNHNVNSIHCPNPATASGFAGRTRIGQM